MLLRLCLSLFLCVSLSLALTCYDCFNTGPDHAECTQERSCKGAACMIFDAGDNKTATAFCLLAMKGDEHVDQKDGCWLEPDGKGKHCLCHTDYCNKLVDRRHIHHSDPMTPLLANAEFLKQNPLVDYENPKLGQDSDEDIGSAPAPENSLFPSAMKADPRIAGHDAEDDDLVPVEFEEYDKDNDKEPKSQQPDDSVSSSPNPPPWVLMFMTMAASFARFLC